MSVVNLHRLVLVQNFFTVSIAEYFSHTVYCNHVIFFFLNLNQKTQSIRYPKCNFCWIGLNVLSRHIGAEMCSRRLPCCRVIVLPSLLSRASLVSTLTLLCLLILNVSGGYPSPCYQSDRRVQWRTHSQPDVQSAGHQCKDFCFFLRLPPTNYFKATGLRMPLSWTCLCSALVT